MSINDNTQALNELLEQARSLPNREGGETVVIAPHIGDNGNWWIGETDTGVKAQGEPGVAVTIVGITESEADGGDNVVRFSDGSVITIKNGQKGSPGSPGSPGAPGAPGSTPIKGVDYFTDAEKAAMVNEVKALLSTETWTFTLENGSTVDKVVYVS